MSSMIFYSMKNVQLLRCTGRYWVLAIVKILTCSLILVTDWLPTLYSAAGGQASDLGPLDGVNQWEALVNGGESARTEMLYNIVPANVFGNAVGAAIR